LGIVSSHARPNWEEALHVIDETMHMEQWCPGGDKAQRKAAAETGYYACVVS
jgi:hypothetical protein